MILHPLSFKAQKSVIFAVTIGNFLEWYEIYLYVYWAPILSKLFFKSGDPKDLIYLFMIFGVGFLARPLGGLFFGRLGDRIGRKKSLILSILMMIVPTFVTGFMPTHEQVGIAAPILLALMRILQSFPAGGELPGAFCYLYEVAPPEKRRYMCSWSAVGYQLGILFSIIECFFIEKIFSPEALVSWGWRLSFIIGGLCGFIGLYLRTTLHETPLFLEMETHEKVVKTPILEVLKQYKKPILMGLLFCAVNSSTFYLLSINFPIDLKESSSIGLVTSVFLLLLITIPLPFFGVLGDRYDNKKMLVGSTAAMLLLLVPYCCTLSLFWLITFVILFCLFFTVTSALIPFVVADLFPTRVRFTCVALSFNLADALIGGFAPAAALYLIQYTGHPNSFIWIIVVTALFSIGAYFKLHARTHTIYQK